MQRRGFIGRVLGAVGVTAVAPSLLRSDVPAKAIPKVAKPEPRLNYALLREHLTDEEIRFGSSLRDCCYVLVTSSDGKRSCAMRRDGDVVEAYIVGKSIQQIIIDRKSFFVKQSKIGGDT